MFIRVSDTFATLQHIFTYIHIYIIVYFIMCVCFFIYISVPENFCCFVANLCKALILLVCSVFIVVVFTLFCNRILLFY